MTAQKWIVACFVLVANVAQASTYSYKDLALKDYREMDILLLKASGTNIIDDVEREPKVREAIEILLSRRNSDGKRSALFGQLQVQLPEAFFLLSVQKVAEAAIADFKSQSTNLSKATDYIILENLLSEIKPSASKYKATLEAIRNENLEISDSFKSYARLEGMNIQESPSQMAENILKVADLKSENDFGDKDLSGKKSEKEVAVINPDFME